MRQVGSRHEAWNSRFVVLQRAARVRDPKQLECHLALEAVGLKGARVKETDYDVATSTAVRASPVASRNNGNFIVSNICTIPPPT